MIRKPYYSELEDEKDKKQKSFALKSGLFFWLFIALFIGLCIIGGFS